MMVNPVRFFLFIVILAFAATFTSEVQALELSSPAFRDGGTIPQEHVMTAIGGKNISPPLEWRNSPEKTESFALSIVDHAPVAKRWVHWLVINIPAATSSLEAGASGGSMPEGSLELRSSYGTIGYGGPQPPAGTGQHPYVITLYALDARSIDLSQDANLSAFKETLEGHVLEKAEITGHYGR